MGQKYQAISIVSEGLISIAEHRAILSKEVATATLKTKTRTKAIARMKRVLVAIPIVGIGIAGYFEKKDFDEWKDDHPNGEFSEYTCEIGNISAEYVDEVLQELPEYLATKIPDRVIVELVPKCQADNI
ncbi:MAG: hypothetical protein P8Q24_07035 [Glaciecola sp.]|nr:hypothetical protein [Glaciecola sp.]